MTRRLVHGTYTAYYELCCRCALCCGYQNNRVARSRAQRLASGNLNHGTRSAYDAGCRCMACRAARSEAFLRLERGDYATRRQP